MQHTVMGLFDTRVQAESARDTLVQTGFAREAIDLRTNPEPSAGPASDDVTNAGMFANIERFLSSLFATGSRALDTTRYAEALRRGAVLVCVNAASESHAELARNTLVRLGATEVDDRLPDWDAQTAGAQAAARREYSVLDELGIGAVMPGTPHTSSATTAAAGAATSLRAAGAPGAAGAAPATAASENTGVAGTTSATVPMGATPRDPRHTTPPDSLRAEPFAPSPLDEHPKSDPLNARASDVDRSAIAAGSVPGSGAVMQPPEVIPERGQPTAEPGARMPNEYLEYEEDFRAHYDEQYASDNPRYEDYVPAYRYGAEIGNDARFRDRPWEEIEPEARRYWETTSPESTWERFKLAVRHGWERVTGHHHA
ncbi:hypothetical protein [Burkholderia sp. Ax-1724]|uniref:hypothetical protein n=1 Tax=Burkholderia sp. Ax-1724 TaxID=2608336 RepID=UPI0014235C6D|nr:hypothetical protein [Burkholderia sp. Ax-1724]NIF51710.1 hypothetical protein [Burkholderia sp. Ax-1724]